MTEKSDNLENSVNHINEQEASEKTRETLVETIMRNQRMIYQVSQNSVSPEWLGIDLTMPQMKIMFLLYSQRKMRMSDIGIALQKNISTATGLVDRLVEHKLVAREEDPDDRRVVVAAITDEGHELCRSLLQYGEQQMQRLLQRLDDAELQLVAQATLLMCKAAIAEAKEHTVKQGHQK